MKKTILALSLAVGLTGLHAQGTVNMNNRNLFDPSSDAPFFDVDGTTRLAGTAFFVKLYAGPAGSSEDALTPVGAAVNFRTGNNAGYMVNADTVRTIPGIPAGGAAVVQLRAWSSNFATYEEAVGNDGAKWGTTDTLILVSTGNPNANPPGTPVDLLGLRGVSGFPTLIPEPSTIALAMLGGAALFLRRRK